MERIEVYLGEIEMQIEFAKSTYNQFLKSYERSDIPMTFMSIHHFLIHISNIDKILDVRNNQLRKEIIGEEITSVDLKQFRKIRNHLEHFDERLDKWIKDYEGQAFFDMNLITGTKGFPQKAFLRALDGMVLKFQGEDYDLELLWKLTLEIDTDIKKTRKENSTVSQHSV